MATKPKFEKDAERMGSRSFGGYAADRALKRHDFAKAGEVARKSPLHPAERPGLAPDVKREVETYAKGGMVGDKKLFPGAKTGIESAAMRASYAKDRADFGSSKSSADDDIRARNARQAGDSARSEVRRETRGKAPEAYAKGGLVGGSAPKSTPYKMSGGRKAKPC